MDALPPEDRAVPELPDPSTFETPAAGLLRIDRSVLPPLEHFLPDDGGGWWAFAHRFYPILL